MKEETKAGLVLLFCFALIIFGYVVKIDQVSDERLVFNYIDTSLNELYASNDETEKKISYLEESYTGLSTELASQGRSLDIVIDQYLYLEDMARNAVTKNSNEVKYYCLVTNSSDNVVLHCRGGLSND